MKVSAKCFICELCFSLLKIGNKLRIWLLKLWRDFPLQQGAWHPQNIYGKIFIEDGVAKTLQSNHKLHHTLCKSHTCEKLDAACLNALIQVEMELKYQDLIIRRQPQLKSFVRQTKCIALAAIKAMLKLVTNEDSGKPTSLAKSFDIQLEKDGITKSMSLYKEQQFTKLGYSAGAILDCVNQMRKFWRKLLSLMY